MVCNSKKGAYTYASAAHPHAVTAAGSDTYVYDANGNLTSGGGRTLTYDLGHRPASIYFGGQTTTFVHDGAVFETRTGAGGRTSVVERVLLRLPAVRVPSGQAPTGWTAVTAWLRGPARGQGR